MPQYAYVARDRDGRTSRGVQEAASDAALVASLQEGELLVLDVRQVAGGEADEETFRPALLRRPRSIDVELGLQQLAFLLRSGVTLLSALQTTAAEAERGSMARVWRRVARRVQRGATFNEALSEHRCFPKVVVTLVAVGEETGNLEHVLTRAADGMERRRAIRTALLTALTYPTITLVLAIAVVAYLMVGLIPKLTTFLVNFGRQLPPMTQALVDMSTWLSSNVVAISLTFLLIVVAVFAFRAWPPGRLIFDRGLLRLPVVGKVMRIAATALFARSFGILVGSGVRVTDALRVVEPLHKNRWIGSRIAKARERVLQGASIAAPLAEGGAFTAMATSMVAVGEASGRLDETLLEVARFHEGRLQTAIRRLSAWFEPIIILVVGGVVGFVYIAFFVALYSIVGGG